MRLLELKIWLKFYRNAYDSKKNDISIAQGFEECRNQYGDVDVLEYFGKTWRISEIIEAGNRVAKALLDLGVKTGDIVSVCLPCVPEFVYYLYAINKIGAISNWIDFRASKEELSDIIHNSECKIAITFDGTDEKVLKVIDECSENIIVIKVYASDSVYGLPGLLLKIKDSNSYRKNSKNNSLIKRHKELIKEVEPLEDKL